MLKVLVADDDEGLKCSLRDYLLGMGFQATAVSNGAEAIDELKKSPYDFCLFDVDMPVADGMAALKAARELCPSSIVIMMTAFSNVPDAVAAMKDGAYNYLSKPVSFESLSQMMKRAIEARAMVQRIVFSAPSLTSNKESLSVSKDGRSFLAKSDRMRQIFGLIEKLAKVDTAVLIRGESGTGKELVACALHYNSLRKDSKFVAVNCSAIPENLVESEFFGHEKGSFTGAHERKIGKFQFANGGTLFLDEVGDLPPLMQVKLLRVLQEKKFTPVGSNREVEVDVRVVAATNRDLESMIKEGKFREDLYYRLNVLPIFLPPLRERIEDIDLLTTRFVAQFNERHKKSIQGLHPMTLALLRSWSWPGNIRELENVIEHAFVLESSSMITPESLPSAILATPEAQLILARGVESLLQAQKVHIAASSFSVSSLAGAAQDNAMNWNIESESRLSSIQANAIGATKIDTTEDDGAEDDGELDWGSAPGSYHAFKETMEKQFVLRALRLSGGRINQAVRDSGIPKKTLLRKIQKYGIDAKSLRDEDAQVPGPTA